MVSADGKLSYIEEHLPLRMRQRCSMALPRRRVDCLGDNAAATVTVGGPVGTALVDVVLPVALVPTVANDLLC